MNKLNSEEMKTLVIATLLMVIGILFCCSIAMGINGLSVVIGFILLVIGILFVINTILNNKETFTKDGLIGIAISTIGIMFIIDRLAGLIFSFIPWFLIIFAIILTIETLLDKFYYKSSNNIEFTIKLIVSILSLALGLCLKLINGFAEYASIILGVFMIIYDIYIVFNVFIKKDNNQN